MNGLLYPVKEAVGVYFKHWFDGLYVDTPDVQEYASRPYEKAVMFAPARMVDAAEDMLASYQKNKTTDEAGANAKFPMVIMAIAKDYTPSGAETGARQVGRKLVTLSDDPAASVYGYRQAMGDVRLQIAVFGAESMSAQSLAAQLGLFVGEPRNRRFVATHKWHDYTLRMPVMLETPDTLFSKVDAANQNMTILIADFTLKVVLPMLDAPKSGEDNDGSDNVPPGYPVVTQALIKDKNTQFEVLVKEPVDKTVLTDALAAAATLVEAEYTPVSWAVLADAVAAGEAVNADEDEPQRLINIAAKDINAAIAALVPA